MRHVAQDEAPVLLSSGILMHLLLNNQVAPGQLRIPGDAQDVAAETV